MRSGRKSIFLGRNQTKLVMSDLEIPPLLDLVLSLDLICVLFCNCTCLPILFRSKIKQYERHKLYYRNDWQLRLFNYEIQSLQRSL